MNLTANVVGRSYASDVKQYSSRYIRQLSLCVYGPYFKLVDTKFNASKTGADLHKSRAPTRLLPLPTSRLHSERLNRGMCTSTFSKLPMHTVLAAIYDMSGNRTQYNTQETAKCRIPVE
jgi:hypothetical protein